MLDADRKVPMKPPIIVNEHGDVEVFTSVEDAEVYLEPIDVRNEEYTAFDSEGRKLSLRVIKSKRRGLFGLIPYHVETVKIECEEAEPQHESDLRSLLSDFLIHFDVPETWIAKASLAEMVERSTALWCK